MTTTNNNEPMSNTTPSPAAGSEELREALREKLTKTWLLSNQIWCADATGTKKETVRFPQQPFTVGPSEKLLNDVMALIAAQNNATYEAVMEAIGEYEDVETVKVARLKAIKSHRLNDLNAFDYTEQVLTDRNIFRAELRQSIAKIFGKESSDE